MTTAIPPYSGCRWCRWMYAPFEHGHGWWVQNRIAHRSRAQNRTRTDIIYLFSVWLREEDKTDKMNPMNFRGITTISTFLQYVCMYLQWWEGPRVGQHPAVVPFIVFHCSGAEVLSNKDINSLLFNTPLMVHNGNGTHRQWACVSRHYFRTTKIPDPFALPEYYRYIAGFLLLLFFFFVCVMSQIGRHSIAHMQFVCAKFSFVLQTDTIVDDFVLFEQQGR